MEELDVSGSFLITIGRGDGPETWVVLSVNGEDGSPAALHFPKNPNEGPVTAFIALSAMFGAFELPLAIPEVQTGTAAGFWGLRVATLGGSGVTVESTRPSSIGIVVDTGKARGQALLCSCKPARVESWFSEKVRHPGT